MNFKLLILLTFALSPVSTSFLENFISHLQKWIEILPEEFEYPFENDSYDETSLDKPVNFESSLKIDLIDNNKHFGNFSNDLQNLIGSYLNDPVYTLGFLNKNSRLNFTETYPLMHYVDSRFDIPELAEVDKNEPELHGILNLSWCRNEPFLLFGSLMEDLESGKKPYKNLVRPLILYLSRLFKELTEHQQQIYNQYLAEKNYCSSYSTEYLLGKICAKNCHYDLIFEVLKDKPYELIQCVSEEVENREDLINFFKSNPEFGMKYKNVFLIIDTATNQPLIQTNLYHTSKWIGECLVYDAPEIFYSGLFTSDDSILCHFYVKFLIYRDIPESEYYRIYERMIKLLTDYRSTFTEDEFHHVYYLTNKICLGPYDQQQEIEMMSLKIENWGLKLLGRAAMFSGKTEIFRKCRDLYYERYKVELIDEIMKYYSDYEKNKSRKHFKIIFEIIESENQILKTFEHLEFVMKFYAVKHLKFEEGQMVFEFVALDDLLALGFPPTIHTAFKYYFPEIESFLIMIFDKMKVVNENTLISFIDDYNIVPESRKTIFINFEIIQLILKSPKLIETLKNKGIDVYLSHNEDIEKLYELPNIEVMSEISHEIYINWINLIKLKTKAHLRLAENMNRGITVDEHFLEFESEMMRKNQELTEIDYFRWRLVFNYWIKGGIKERIKKIQSSTIIRLLRMEFPDEMNKIIGPEQKKDQI